MTVGQTCEKIDRNFENLPKLQMQQTNWKHMLYTYFHMSKCLVSPEVSKKLAVIQSYVDYLLEQMKIHKNTSSVWVVEIVSNCKCNI